MVALADEAIAAGQSATVDTGGGEASLRSDPSFDAEVITMVPDGTSVTILEGPVSGADGSLWYSASADGSTGYLSADLVTGAAEPSPPEAADTPDTTEEDPAETEAAGAETAVPSIPWKEPVDMGVVVDNASEPLPQDGLACRADARADADVITRLVPGNTLEVTGAELWVEGVAFLPVNCAGVGGFVRSDYIELVSEAAAAEEADAAPVEVAADVEVVAEVTEEVATEDVVEEEAEVAPEEALAEELVAEQAATEADMPEEVAAEIEVEVTEEAVAEDIASEIEAPEEVVAEETAAEAIETEEVVVEDPAADEAVEDEVPAEDATTDEVVADEVVAEEPVAEEAVTEEPAAEEPVAEEVAAEEPLAEEPVTEEPVAEEVTPEAAVVEDPAVDEATEEPASQVAAEDVEATEETAAEPAQAEQVEAEEETARTPEPTTAGETSEAVPTETASAEPAATEAAPEDEEDAAEVETAAAPAEVQFNDQVTTTQQSQDTVDPSQVIGTAEVVGTNGEGLRCRTAASADASTITVLAEGTTVQVLSVDRNGYLGVICGGQAGYADVDFLYSGGAGDEIAANAGSVTVVGSGSGLNCRSGAGLSYRVITIVRDGTTLMIRGASINGWAPVVCGGQNGYVSIDYVEAAGSTSNSGSTDGRVGAATTTMTVTGTNGDGVRCRTAASTSSSIITVLAEGTRVTTRGAASGGWVPVTCGGASGYISAQFLSAGSGSTDGGSGTGTGISSGYVQVTGTGGGGLRCRTTASTSGAVIMVIAEGRSAQVRGAASNGWQPVICGGRNGFVSTQFITASSGGTAPGGSTPTPTPAPSPVTGSATVSGTNGTGVRCRGAASTSANVITVLAEGTRVSTRGSAQGGWVPVVCGGTSGYVSAQYLTIGGTAPAPSPTPSPTPTPTPPATSGMVSGDRARVTDTLNLRYSASTGAGIATTAPAGTVVLITGGVTNGFYPVNWDGLKGFMSKDYLVKTTAALSERGGSGDSSPPPTSGDSGSNATGNAMASFALRYEGYPYVWATHGPSSFDCSGFTYWVTKNVTGKDIGWGLWSQVSAGTPVSRANLQPGDLVFFQNTYKAGLSHSGVYIGNNRFIHAENESTGVRISDLNSTYYGSRWYGAVRMT